MTKRNIKKDIAIIGMAGRFPKSEDLNAFWDNLANGNELISAYTDEEVLASGVKEEQLEEPNFVKAGARIENPENFDHAFFGYTKPEASHMDPQIRVLHEEVWLALEDAGINPYQYAKKIGLYLNARDNFNWRVHDWINRDELVNSFYQDKISRISSIGTLISYNLNLKGPSFFVDTACSSSLTATHLACRALLTKDCAIALAGGITIDSDPTKGYYFEDGLVHSQDGHCRTFDKDSTGTVGGEGVGVIVLKRLEEAINDHDHIYAVIRSTAVNNDGNRKVGFTAPSVNGQSECIQLAHKIAGITHKEITYVEAHGTGTRLGDPVEVEGLNKAFMNDTAHRCAIGSVKSNMGHLDGAAGIAGLIKTALALKHKKIPPSISFEEANPEIDFHKGPFYVNATLSDWETKAGKPRMAGVSSYGIGGTNGHVILEEAPERPLAPSTKKFQLLVSTAKSQAGLERYQEKLKGFIEKQAEISDHLAYTLKTRREAFRYRSFIVGEGKEDLLAQYDTDTPLTVTKSGPKKIVFMFPGSGTQYRHMGQDLYEGEPFFREMMDKGFVFLKSALGVDFQEVLYGENTPSININDNRYTQPLVFIIEYAYARLLMKWGIQPDQMIGHSTGEYVAACISGVFSYEEGLALIIGRAGLISQTAAGGMLTVGLSEEATKALLNSDLSLAAVNAPEYSVVSGKQEAIDRLFTDLERQGVTCSKLRVSVAGHSFLMDPILPAFEEKVNQVALQAPSIPFISNISGKEITVEEATSTKYWVKHLRETVNFNKGVAEIIRNDTNNLFIEVGPGSTLKTFLNQIIVDKEQKSIVNLVRHPKEEINDLRFLTEKLGQLWAYGAQIDWEAYYEGCAVGIVPAPGYSFEKTKLPATVNVMEELHEKYAFSDTSIDHWFYFPEWKKSLLPHSSMDESVQNFLIFDNGTAGVDQLIKALLQKGHQVTTVVQGEAFQYEDGKYVLHPEKEGDYQQLFDHLETEADPIDHIVFSWSLSGENQSEILQQLLTFVYCCKALGQYQSGLGKKLTCIGHYGHPITLTEKMDIGANSIMGLISVLDQEYPELFSCSIDVDMESANPILLERLIADLLQNTTTKYVAYRHRQRFELCFNQAPLTSPSGRSILRENGVYLITGGYGKVAAVLALYLIKNYKAKVALLGRSPLPQEADLVSLEGKLETFQIALLKEYYSSSDQLYYYQGDVSDYASLQSVVVDMKADIGEVAGVIHTAAEKIDNQDTFAPVAQINEAVIQKQFSPKVDGVLNIRKVFEDSQLDFVWLTSSNSTWIGGIAYGAYAVANRFMDAYVEHHKESLPHWYCVNLEGIGKDWIDFKYLPEILERTLTIGDIPQIAVSNRNLNDLVLKQSPQDEKQEAEDEVTEELALDNYVAPSTEVEKQLVEVWQPFFSVNKIGVFDNFFELGGDSLKALTISRSIFKAFNVELKPKDFFKNPTIRSIGQEIEIGLKMKDLQNAERESGETMNELTI